MSQYGAQATKGAVDSIFIEDGVLGLTDYRHKFIAATAITLCLLVQLEGFCKQSLHIELAIKMHLLTHILKLLTPVVKKLRSEWPPGETIQ